MPIPHRLPLALRADAPSPQMILGALRSAAAALAAALCVTLCATAPLRAQRVSTGTLEAQTVPRADTTVIWRSGTKDLVAELRVPSGNGPYPVAIVIHGGCWITKYADTRYMRPMAEALKQAGIASWTIAYRRADEDGGGWPGTFLDVAAEARMLRELAPRYHLDLTRVIASGHSAGAHLALWLAAQPKLPGSSAARATTRPLPIHAVVALDGPGDLVASNTGIGKICGGNVLEQLLGSLPDAQPARWREASPSEFLPLGVPQAMVRGSLDARLYTFGSAAGAMTPYAERARRAGDSSWVVIADTSSHFTMLEPTHPAFAVVLQAMRDALAAIRPARGDRP